MTHTQLPITMVMHPDYARHVTGLSRYALALSAALEDLPELEVRYGELSAAPLPPVVVALGQRFGLGFDAFLRTYPLVWPANSTGIVHLTHRSQATLLWHKGGRKVVVTVHDIIHYQHRHNPTLRTYRHPIQASFDWAAVQALRRADAILASSEHTRRVLIAELGLPAERVTTVPLGVDQQRFRQQEVPAEFYARYGLDPATPYILHISSEEPRKNLPLLVQAFAELHKCHPEVRLLKIGRPLYPTARQALHKQIDELGLQGAILLIDNVPDADLPHFYGVARLFAFPSREEGFGFPVLEAMACGTPVVCAAAASLPELAGDGALLVAPDDCGGLLKAMEDLLTRPELRAQQRARGLQQAATYTWQRTAEKTYQVYQQLSKGITPCA
jgi:glycosyltransferase involved in cell wall biosynthesis